ncbi:MAG: fatty acid desaturase [Rhodothermales bacterium]
MQDELSKELQKSALINSKGETYMEFRKTLTPRWGVVWSHIALGWMALALFNLSIVLLSGQHLAMDFLLIGIGSIVIGFNIAYLQLFFHEAAHFNLHADRKVNDVLCNLFVSGIVGQDIKQYRPIHWNHHRHLGSPEDTEISYFDPLNIKLLVTSLLGIRALKVIALRKKEQEKSQKNPIPYTLIAGMTVNLIYLSILMYFNQWVLIIAWAGGIFAWFPFFGVLRQIIEHRDEYADLSTDYTTVVHGAIHRLFGDSVLASTLGGAGFNRHLLHHWDPQVSYTRLREIEHFLMDTQGAAYLKEHVTTYSETFRRLFQPVWR